MEINKLLWVLPPPGRDESRGYAPVMTEYPRVSPGRMGLRRDESRGYTPVMTQFNKAVGEADW